ncbi:MAG TPA: hypothetical protein ACHBY4_14265 [Arsenophonus apicola]
MEYQKRGYTQNLKIPMVKEEIGKYSKKGKKKEKIQGKNGIAGAK